MSAISLRLSAPLYKAVRKIAEQDNISINEFITLALTEKVSALMTEDFLMERAKQGRHAELDAAPSKVADAKPE
jgi:hypothetical protein